MLNFTEHEDRNAVLAELHIRPFQTFTTPQRFYHFAFVIDPREAAREIEAFTAFCGRIGAPPPGPHPRFHLVKTGDWTLRWELHTEFVTYTWSTATNAATSFAGATSDLPEAFRQHEPVGQLLVQTELALVARMESHDGIEEPFERGSLTVITAAEDGAIVASDFRASDNSVIRILVEDLMLTPTRAGRLVQRLLELETYRCLALLGLPVARRSEATVRHVEAELLRLSREMSTAETAAERHEILHQITALSTELETQLAANGSRLEATRAYAELVRARLEVIREREHSGYVSFSRFLRRRFSPAITTCAAIENRQHALALRLAHATDLLRTSIQSELEDQNRLLLASMNRRGRLQLRLQQTVEGLSIAAISYYIVGLLGYVAKGTKEAGILPAPVTPEMVMGASVPFVVLIIWRLLRRVRKSWGNNK